MGVLYCGIANTTRRFTGGNTKGWREKKSGEEGETGGGESAGRVKRWRGKERGGVGEGKTVLCERKGRQT